MFITIINDCKDQNAAGRQAARVACLFNIAPTFVGVQSDIEASGNIIDVLDATEGKKGIILANVAPRNGSARKFKNGTPFGFFYWRHTLVISSVAGNTLSFLRKFGIAESIRMMNIPHILKAVAKTEHLTKNEQQRIAWSQFRSFDFLPRIAFWISKGIKIPTKKYVLKNARIEPRAWAIDCFGNIKTSLLRSDIQLQKNGFVKTKFGNLKFYPLLRNVPDNHAAIIIGSSGLGNNRFLEIAVQGKSAAELFGIKIGDAVL